MKFSENDAPVLIVLGQSNAHGHGTQLPKNLEINTPLENVKGLTRAQNQSYDLNDVTWSGFTSHSMNLGIPTDHTYCLGNEFARRWQAHIDAGNHYSLPDLYVIQISIGGMGVHEFEVRGQNMWWRERPKIIYMADTWVETSVSLYPLATEILSLAMKNLKSAGKTPRIIGLHWNQWECEVDTGGDAISCAKENYSKLFSGFHAALGEEFPLYLYRPLSEVFENPVALNAIDELFLSFVKADNHVKMLDLSKSILFDASRENKGIFQDDFVHYLPAAHEWFADTQFFDVIAE